MTKISKAKDVDSRRAFLKGGAVAAAAGAATLGNAECGARAGSRDLQISKHLAGKGHFS